MIFGWSGQWESHPCPKFGTSGLLDIMAWAQKGHWLPANDKYLAISSQKIAAFSSIISKDGEIRST
jgi:hypothetical protein